MNNFKKEGANFKGVNSVIYRMVMREGLTIIFLSYRGIIPGRRFFLCQNLNLLVPPDLPVEKVAVVEALRAIRGLGVTGLPRREILRAVTGGMHHLKSN